MATPRRAKNPKKERSREFVCIVCGKSYTAERRTSRYCSDACKQKQYRERSKTYEG